MKNLSSVRFPFNEYSRFFCCTLVFYIIYEVWMRLFIEENDVILIFLSGYYKIIETFNPTLATELRKNEGWW